SFRSTNDQALRMETEHLEKGIDNLEIEESEEKQVDDEEVEDQQLYAEESDDEEPVEEDQDENPKTVSQVVAPAKGLIDECVAERKVIFPEAAFVLGSLSSMAKIIQHTASFNFLMALEEAGKLKEQIQSVNYKEKFLIVKAFLEETLPALENIIKGNMTSFKSFIVNHQFTTDIVINVELHLELIPKMEKYQTVESVEAYQKHYENNDALSLAMQIRKRFVMILQTLYWLQ
ncbi:hypothetical protein PENTCL1PPCAC_21669, partial [Pristionchus entomophagus]